MIWTMLLFGVMLCKDYALYVSVCPLVKAFEFSFAQVRCSLVKAFEFSSAQVRKKSPDLLLLF